MRRLWTLIAAAAALATATPLRAETCDDHVEGPPPKTFFDRTRWDIGVRGEAPWTPSIGGRIAAEYSITPNVDLGLRADYGYQKGGLQTVILSAETRIYPWYKYGGTGANVCGYKPRVWTHAEGNPQVLLSGAPYFLLSIGGGLDVAPDVRGAWNGRLGAGWDFYLGRMATLFVEAGGAVGAMNGFFGSLGFRF